MLFNSVTFAIFFPAVLALYWLLRTARRQNLLLVVASAVFYGWWDWRFLFLLGASVVTDYFCALGIQRHRERGSRGRPWMIASLILNLGILGIFKYYDFFIGSAEQLWLSVGWRPDLLSVVLPVGISFYTFQTLSYTVDVYRGNFEARRNFVDVAAYVMFFPQLVAGPIERASRLIPQMERPRTLTEKSIQIGLMLIVTGLLKKMVLADGAAPIVELYFGKAAQGEITGWEVLIGNLAFAWQIYGDFSGYSDIARGTARLMGFDLMINFRQPYFARSFSELFDRWHISLSTWLRDYLFIPLGGTRGGTLYAARNLTLTMFLAGLWHGANWTFATWGLLMGVLLVAHRALGLTKPQRWSYPLQLVGIATTFLIWCSTGPLFRGVDIATSGRMYKAFFFGPWGSPSFWHLVAVALGGVLCLAIDASHAFHPDEELPNGTRRGWMLLTCGLAAACFWVVQPLANEPFIYFQF